jgi:hypothetical protein
MKTLRFKSQIEYGIYGANICTPVCCIVASNYLLNDNNEDIQTVFSPKKMDAIMRACHNLYAECFSKSGVNMMLADVQRYFPPSFKLFEVAGMTISGQAETVENLLLQPFGELLANEIKKDGSRVILVTRLDHTICYLFDGRGCVLLFDPLEASIQDVSDSWKSTVPTKDTQYSGLILTKQTGCDGDVFSHI